MSQNTFEDFNVRTVGQTGKNLVEASAGTGKTFSIGILVLRLVLENEIPIEKILLVTFTKNAVAELEERIRSFVRQANNYLVNDGPAIDDIKEVVDASVANKGRKAAILSLQGALLFLDQLAVMTIHSFCQQTLNNQAFETGQLFGSELRPSMDEVYEFYVNQFWRKHINTLPIEIYQTLKQWTELTPHTLSDLVKNFYSDKIFFLFEREKKYESDIHIQQQEIRELTGQQNELKESFRGYLRTHHNALEQAMQTNRYTQPKIPLLDSPGEMLAYLLAGIEKGTKYIEKIFGGLMPLLEDFRQLNRAFVANATLLLNQIYCYALYEITGKVDLHNRFYGIMSYDGLIKNLHSALMGKNRDLVVKELRSQYKAVFVDEFQDTDRLQYDIFKTAFHADTILFYIGDPKQSIFAFRQADINTYLSTYSDVDQRYSMNTNYRSTPRMVSALNTFFLPSPGFDTFKFDGQPHPITYKVVAAHHMDPQDDFFHAGRKQTPLIIEKWDTDGAIKSSLVNKILELLTDKKYNIAGRGIKPSDIGILVKTNGFGKEIKNLLAQKNIPAVIINEEKIMQSPEADALFYVLRAMQEPTIENIRTGLINDFSGKQSSEIISMKAEDLIAFFREYKALWEDYGVNQAISRWMADFGVRDYLIHPDTVNGLRIISNLEQLKELIIKTEYLQRLNPGELLDWMKRAKDMELLDEDERTIRLESDADAVTITTVHKAKGLEYNIVFSPQSDMKVKDHKKTEFVSIYSKDDKKYILIPCNQLSEEQIKDYYFQGDQESRRLLYVAFTRAVYACFAYTNSKAAERSNFAPFLEELKPSDLIKISESPERAEIKHKYAPEKTIFARPERLKTNFELKEPFWQYMSYTGLTPAHLYTPPEMTNKTGSDYDAFVFDRLRRGNITGTMLHEIFEKIDFQNTQQHFYHVQSSVARYASSHADIYQQYITEMISHVMEARISTGQISFSLRDIPHERRLHELEFDFPVHHFDTNRFTALCNKGGIHLSIVNRSDLYGMMSGFIDLFFAHEGRYYVLDWKSNFLGNLISHYTGQSLETAMADNNYHLQYVIYTLAAVKYLNQRLPGFNYDKHFGGIIYCFLRGMRSGNDSGVFFRRLDAGLVAQLEQLMLH